MTPIRRVSPFLSLLLVGLLCLSCAGPKVKNRPVNPPSGPPPVSSPPAPQKTEESALAVNTAVERNMAGTPVGFDLKLADGTFLQVTVEQRGTDVSVALLDQAGVVKIEVDNQKQPRGNERLAFVAETGGAYRLEIRPRDKTEGKVSVRIDALRAATEGDRDRIAATDALIAAERLRQQGLQGTRDALEAATGKATEAAGLFRKIGDKNAEANALNTLGRVYLLMDERPKAIEVFERALPLWRAAGNRGGESASLNNIGLAYDDLGERRKALEYYDKVLALDRAEGNQANEAETMVNIAKVYGSLGEFQKSLDNLSKAVPVLHEAKRQRSEALALNNYGFVFNQLGNFQRAIEYYTRILPILHEIKDIRNESLILNNIGLAYERLDDRPKALEYYAKALNLRREVGNRRGEADTLTCMGRVYLVNGDAAKAFECLEKALPLRREVGDRRGEAFTLTMLGRAYFEGKNYQKAHELVTQAIPLRRAVGDRGGEAASLFHLAKVERELGNLALARRQIEKAIELVEFIRSNAGNEENRTSYFATVQEYYEFYLHLLTRMHGTDPTRGYDREALRVSERARARGLLELLGESREELREGVDSRLLEKEREVRIRLADKLDRMTQVLNTRHTPEQESRVKQDVDAVTEEYRRVREEIRENSPRYAALTQPRILTAEDIQTQVLDSETVLVEYALGETGSLAWVVSDSSFATVELAPRKEIEDAARRVYDLLFDPTSGLRTLKLASLPKNEDWRAVTELSDLVVKPLAGRLGKKRLLVVPDGALQYIPFSVLPKPGSQSPSLGTQPLILSHEIVTVPSASTVAALRRDMVGRKPASRMLAVLADPVFEPTDDRVPLANRPGPAIPPVSNAKADGGENLAGQANVRTLKLMAKSGGDQAFTIPRLPFTRKEAESVLALAGGTSNLKALDFDANREKALSGELSDFKYLHFATHGVLDTERPELSSVLLSMTDREGRRRDGFLRLVDVFNLKLSADLVVLSACETGLGKEIKGEGLVGLTRGFMYAGTPRVIVSLWSVNDEATSRLMMSFYRKMLREGQPPAAALRSAQLEMLRSPKYSSPFFWAPFIVQGEWK